jgi:hypothetical protein
VKGWRHHRANPAARGSVRRAAPRTLSKEQRYRSQQTGGYGHRSRGGHVVHRRGRHERGGPGRGELHEDEVLRVNACKGQSVCKCTGNAYKGQNACKGEGFEFKPIGACERALRA